MKKRSIILEGDRYTFVVPAHLGFWASVWRSLLLSFGDDLCRGKKPWPRLAEYQDAGCLRCLTEFLIDPEIAWVKLVSKKDLTKITYWPVHRACGGDVRIGS